MIEIMVVVAVVAIIAAIAVASLSRMNEKAELREAATDLVSYAQKARSLAKSGAVPVTTWPVSRRSTDMVLSRAARATAVGSRMPTCSATT